MPAPSTKNSVDAEVTRVDFAVSGMHCASCVSAIDSYVRSLDGIENVNVNLLLKRATVTFATEKVTPKAISDAISELGYKVRICACV
jgi:Cu2+-exporting ATPase